MNSKKLFLACLAGMIALVALWMRYYLANEISGVNGYGNGHASNGLATNNRPFRSLVVDGIDLSTSDIVFIPHKLVALSSNDFQKVVFAAERSNDVTAAVDLADYYGYAVNDVTNLMKYLRIAASRGDVISEYNLGFMYANNDAFKNLDLAKYWLGIAANSGSVYAKQQLELIGHK